ncbi:MAG: hypothetical protein ACRD2R_08640 [Terriglobales bacterium]
MSGLTVSTMAAGPWIFPGRDRSGMETAFAELFEEAFEASERARTAALAADAANSEAMLASLKLKRSLADGYYRWAEYIFELEAMAEAVSFRARELEAAELEGLRALKRARARFQEQHPGCARCGQPNRQYALSCRSCGEKFKR